IGTIRKTSLLRIVPTACGQAADRHEGPIHIGTRVLGDCVSNERSISERSYLFTMSDIARGSREPRAKFFLCKRAQPSRLVEPDGIEPTTSCLQSRRSPN